MLTLPLDIPPERAGQRLDKLVLEACGGALSRSRLKELFAEGRVRLDGRRARASDLGLPGEHRLEIDTDEATSAGPARAQPDAEAAARVAVLYEDDDLLVLDKPSGMPSLPHAPAERGTAVGAALALRPELASAHPATTARAGLEPGLVHRLDTGTSGVLVFAKSSPELARLREAWQSPLVTKTYLAAVSPGADLARLGPLPRELRPWLGHDASSSRRMLALDEDADESARSRFERRIRGKPLLTETRLIAAREERDFVELEVAIRTGAMHQIRATLAMLGVPIVGDEVYGGGGASRLMLHAWRVELPLSSGKRLVLASIPPWRTSDRA